MKRNHKMTVVSVIAAALVMLAGAGYAFAQSDSSGSTQAAPAAGEQPDQGCPGPGGLRQHLLGGEVVKVENNTITVKTRKGDEKAVKVDDQTKYRKDGKDATMADVTAGEKIGVGVDQPPTDGSDPVAKVIMIGQPPAGGPGGARHDATVGTVKSVDGDTVTVTTPQGDKQVKLPSIAAGQRIAVVNGADGSVKGVMYNPPEKPQEAPAPADAPAGNNT